MDRTAQEREDHILDCYETIKRAEAQIDRLLGKLEVAISTIDHLNNCLVGQPDHDIGLAADTQLILRDLRSVALTSTERET